MLEDSERMPESVSRMNERSSSVMLPLKRVARVLRISARSEMRSVSFTQ